MGAGFEPAPLVMSEHVTRISYEYALPSPWSTNTYSIILPTPKAIYPVLYFDGKYATPYLPPYSNCLSRSIHWRQYAIHCPSPYPIWFLPQYIGDSTRNLFCRPHPKQIVLSNSICIVPASLSKCCNQWATVAMNLTMR